MLKGQSRTQSLLEVVSSTIFGLVIAVLTQYWLFPLLNIKVDAAVHLIIAAVFTIVSIIRSYVFRRLFNWIYLKNA